MHFSDSVFITVPKMGAGEVVHRDSVEQTVDGIHYSRKWALFRK